MKEESVISSANPCPTPPKSKSSSSKKISGPHAIAESVDSSEELNVSDLAKKVHLADL